MSDRAATPVLAEPSASYSFPPHHDRWVEILVDCPDVQKSFTYHLPSDLSVQPGDIVSVPFGVQVLGGIVLRLSDSLPPGLNPQQVKDVREVIATGFFPPSYWQLLNRICNYYYTSLVTAIRVALPPGVLRRSQQRIRLNREAIPQGAEIFCSATARAILQLLSQQPDGNYSAQYLQRQVKGARRGLQELLKRGWVASYLEPPKAPRPKRRKAVILTGSAIAPDLTDRQREVWEVLRREGGELWLSDLLQRCGTSYSVVEALERKGCAIVQEQEVLRLATGAVVMRDSPKTLTAAQAKALEVLTHLKGYAQVLLHGVTGSGKTEIYLQAIAPCLERGQSALVLVPEIGLTPQLTDRFRQRFGSQVCVYHSALSDGERYDTWRQMLQGEPQVAIGTRSAIFAPLPNLGMIILDEEHDSSFKQERPAPTYHARTVAQWRAELEGCPLILGSATPALETWVAVQERDANSPFYALSLPQRIQSRPFPQIEIVDMRRELQQGNRSIFSQSLQAALRDLKQQGQQGILFIPRRGHSTFVGCRSCGCAIECPHCDVSLSYHHIRAEASQLLRCHYCNYVQTHPSQCPECGSPYLKFFGSGTQKVTQELTKNFPDLRFIRFDSDTTRTKGAHRNLLTRFARGEADLLVGTQMLTKGLDLAQITLVGIVAADGLLHRSDYRAGERAFQTLTQVAGRAGRGDDPGRAIAQTYSPEHPVIQALCRHDYAAFAPDILKQRAEFNYPPYGCLILLQFGGLDEREVRGAAEIVAEACHHLLSANCEILGPAPAPVMRLNRRYRWQILLKFAPAVRQNLPDLAQLRDLCPQSVSFGINVDPLSLE